MKINNITSYWHSRTRVVFMTEDTHGLVEIEYPKDNPELGYIWHLWVDHDFREQGYATALLDAAEQHISESGCASAVLDWDKRDTSVEILEWYQRRGYRETEFGRWNVRMEKALR